MSKRNTFFQVQGYQGPSTRKIALFSEIKTIVTMTLVTALLLLSCISTTNAHPLEDKNHFALGIRAYQSGHLPLALSYFEDAIVNTPHNPTLLYYLGNTHYKMGHFLKAADAFQQVMAVAPPTSDAYRYAMRGLIRLSSPRLFENTHTLSNRIQSGTFASPDDHLNLNWSDDNYSDQIRYNSQNVRWSTTQGPLHIYIDEHPTGLSNFQPAYVQMARKGLSEWLSALDNQLKAVYVNQPSQADIRVEWVNQLDKSGFQDKDVRTFHAGLTTPRFEEQQLKQMRVRIATLDVDGKPQSNSMMQTIITHELGHALGITGHSPDSKDLMHFRSIPDSHLSPRDKATIRLLYGNAADITHAPPVREAPDRESAQSQNTETLQRLTNQVNKEEANVAREGNYLNYLNLGTAYFNKAKYLSNLIQANGTAPEQPKLWYQNALNAMDKAVELQPNSALAVATKAYVQRDLGQYNPALAGINQAIQLDPGHGEYYRERAHILALMGRKAEAQNALNDYLLREPYEKDASAVKQIKQLLNPS